MLPLLGATRQKVASCPSLGLESSAFRAPIRSTPGLDFDASAHHFPVRASSPQIFVQTD